MRGIWTTERIRSAEERLLARVADGALMRTAAFGVSVRAARILAEHAGAVAGRRVALLVGAGNNGGDALWAGAFLRRRGVAVAAVLLAPDRTHAQGLAALRRAGGRVVSVVDGPQWIEAADLVVDGIVGLSARGPLRPEAAELVRHIAAPVLSVDLPSGVDPDTGVVDGPAVRADHTVTFGARKPVHVMNPGRCGAVSLIDFGLGTELGEPDLHLLDGVDVAAAWPMPGMVDDKYTQGVTGIAAGSATYPGAAVLATGAAVLATSGMVRYAGPAADVVRSRWPEVVATGAVTDAGRAQAWVAGPGIGTGHEGRQVLRHVLGLGVPVCADADAITILASNPEVLDARDPGTPLVLTPHDREFARIAGAEPGADRVTAARELASRVDAVVLLKGHSTIVAAPDGRALVNVPEGSWLATAGTGDVLAGLVGALLAAGLDPWLACGAAAYVHSLSARLAAEGAPVSASGVQAAIPAAIRAVRSLS
ncbi:bifunctional ADP-dependent NAD(P)H-hydrate dehydratase/NAD(P)H-hydrate epimerase [Amycolatopsis antarctica]|uniref:Bifunctional NAD(P)H-hydrate repair enzyme n=1 Tax=Amycolatopsis antarctica TaxID=1854586 RepID=A0A263DC04_9PSEU|nr:NAD(P)H-hydrate dehydratase [Amycolatopsis antarctica]OZM74925.1 bifunctional ADP-dependent NAD(P)H-hydrate dehydratase/NAD(P)H-hydrate epimerase [Amycolatopsis antarctica]